MSTREKACWWKWMRVNSPKPVSEKSSGNGRRIGRVVADG